MSPQREIVEAGAGCGKTTRLVARYIEAISTYSPSKVLAVTFSKEAAAQMRQRIEKSLIEQGKSELAQRIKTEAQISTFHSLCFKLLEPHLESRGLSKNLKSSAEVRYLRKTFLLSKLAGLNGTNTQAFSEILSAINLQSFLETCHQFWNLAGWTGSEPSNNGSESDFLSKMVEKEFASLNIRFQDFCAQTRTEMKGVLAEFPESATEVAWIEQVDKFLKNPFLKVSDGGPDPSLIKFSKSPKIKKAFPNFALRAYQIKSALESQILEGLSPKCLDFELKLHAKLGQLLETLRKEEPQRLLDFEIIEKEWLQIFNQNSEDKIREIMGPAPRVLLVDEFQDTNPAQFKILEKLSDEKTEWFFVGDPKQSIYFFRGADVSLFLESKEKLTARALDTNYRSDPGLLKFFNIVQNELFTLSERFSTSGGNFQFDPPPQILKPKPEVSDKLENPVEIFEFENPRKGRAAVNSDLYFDVYLNIKKNQDLLGETSTHAVLFQSWNELYSFSEYLNNKGLAHGISGADNVLDHPLTEIFIEFVQVLVNPEDSYARALLERWLEGKIPFENKSSDFLCKFLEISKNLSVLGNFHEDILGAFCQLMVPGRFANGYTWSATIETYLKSWDKAMPPEFFSLSEKLRMLRSTFPKNETKIEILETVKTRHPLTLLTVHGSKGLEFDAVYLAQMGGSARSNSMLLTADSNNTSEIDTSENSESDEGLSKKVGFQIRDQDSGTTRPGLLYNFDRTINKTRLEAEKRRLFYVALTRAVHKVSCFYFRPQKDIFEKWDTENQKHAEALLGCPTPFSTPWNFVMDYLKNENVFAELLTQSKVLSWTSGVYPQSEESSESKQLDPGAYPKRNAILGLMSPVRDVTEAGFVRTSVTRWVNSLEAENSSDKIKAPKWSQSQTPQNNQLDFTQLGIDLHSFIEIWSGESLTDFFKSSDLTKTRPQAHNEVLKKGLAEIRALPELSAFWADVKSCPNRVMREWPLEIALHNTHLTGIIDAVWKKSETEWVIIDWKSTRRIENLLTEDRVNKIQNQLSIYSKALKASVGNEINITCLAVAMAWGPRPKAEVLFSHLAPKTNLPARTEEFLERDSKPEAFD